MPMQSMRTRVQALSIGLIGLVLAGCNTVAPYSNAAFNVKLQPPDPASPAASAPRHTFAVNGKRGPLGSAQPLHGPLRRDRCRR